MINSTSVPVLDKCDFSDNICISFVAKPIPDKIAVPMLANASRKRFSRLFVVRAREMSFMIWRDLLLKSVRSLFSLVILLQRDV